MPRLTRLCLAMLLCSAVVGALALAAAAQTGAAQTGTAKPKPPPIVTVKKADGSTVRGVIERSDGKQVTIKPTKGNAFGEPVDVAWADVKSVSNGFTRQKALDAWKLEHKSDLCDDCHGDAHTACATCKGVGHDPASSKGCKTCKGELLVDCPDKRCDAGKVPCPEPCLKASDPGWSKPDESGKRWRTFGASGGAGRVSDGHLGEIMRRGTRGEAPQLVACETCGKTGVIPCPKCGGNAQSKIPCPTCKADKSAADCADCDAGLVPCKTCGETGLKTGAPPASAENPAPPESPAPATPAKPPADNNDGF